MVHQNEEFIKINIAVDDIQLMYYYKLIFFIYMCLGLGVQLSWAAHELLEHDFSLSLTQFDYHWAWVELEEQDIRLESLWAYSNLYIFLIILFIFIIYILIYTISRLIFEFELEYDSINIWFELNRLKFCFFFHWAEVEFGTLRLNQFWVKFQI